MTKRKTAAAPIADSEPTPDNGETAAAPPPVTPGVKTPRPETKMAALVAMLRSPDGATIGEMRALTGWQEHSVRGALAGALKRRFGLTISSTKEDERGRVYRANRPDTSA